MYTNLDLKTEPKKGTDNVQAHTDVFVKGKYVGYYMPNRSEAAAVNENWNFVSEDVDLHYFHSKTRNELISTLLKQLNKEHVILKQHFGILNEINFLK